MRMSCNGCRILRKGCGEDCTLRPSLQWIKSPESQANATLFLAKFYGRAGLINLINAGPAHLRPAIFKSLLFEACGRIINPVYGSVGLMCSGDWARCQAAVEAVLSGTPLVPKLSNDDNDSSTAVQKSCDIRHLSKDAAAASLHRVRTRNRFKRTAKSHVENSVSGFLSEESEAKFTITGWEEDQRDFGDDYEDQLTRAPSQDSFSVETVELALVKPEEEHPVYEVKPEVDVGLELTLGFNPVYYSSAVIEISDSEA